ncbi:MAG: hypothetical protein ACPG8W_11840 [Candidatus Promineifilaceae bacterium]
MIFLINCTHVHAELISQTLLRNNWVAHISVIPNVVRSYREDDQIISLEQTLLLTETHVELVDVIGEWLEEQAFSPPATAAALKEGTYHIDYVNWFKGVLSNTA